MEKRLSNIFKTTIVTKLIKAILKCSHRVLQVTSKWKTLRGHSKSTFAQDSQVLTPPPPLLPCSFSKSTLCHDFPNPDLLEGPKDGMIKENAVFFILKSSNKVDYISTLITPDHEVKIIYNQWISSIVWVGKSYRTPIIDRTEYYNLSCWFV